MMGSNTLNNTLKNKKYQLRSEPQNPRQNVNPWNQSTMEPDRCRRPMEIGIDGCASENSIQHQSNFSSGATVLKNKSHQKFKNTSQIQNIDESLVTELSLRLIVDNYNGHYGKKGYYNVDPPRIENMMQYDQISAL